MFRRTISSLIFLVLVSLAANSVDAQTESSSPPQSPRPALERGSALDLAGRWQVKFAFVGRGEKNLIFEAKAKGSGSFLMLDTEPEDKPATQALPAAWSQLTNDRVSFSGEVELPIGTCCREIGTLLFKGKFTSGNSLSGKIIFVTSVDEEENPYQFRSLVGTFSGTRILK